MHSQKSSTNNGESRPITTVQRDSIFVKIQRGKLNAEKVVILKKALATCGETKEVYKQLAEVQRSKADSLGLIVVKQEDLADTVKQISDMQLKEQKKKTTRAFIKGGIAGAIIAILTAAATVIF